MDGGACLAATALLCTRSSALEGEAVVSRILTWPQDSCPPPSDHLVQSHPLNVTHSCAYLKDVGKAEVKEDSRLRVRGRDGMLGVFTIHRHESAMGVHVFPNLNPPPTFKEGPGAWFPGGSAVKNLSADAGGTG